MKDINVKAGQNFQIHVPFTGFPKPTAVWMNGTKEIEDDHRVHLKVADDHVLLTNTKAERGDSGRYRLTLKNASGQDSGSLNVNVIGKLICSLSSKQKIWSQFLMGMTKYCFDISLWLNSFLIFVPFARNQIDQVPPKDL